NAHFTDMKVSTSITIQFVCCYEHPSFSRNNIALVNKHIRSRATRSTFPTIYNGNDFFSSIVIHHKSAPTDSGHHRLYDIECELDSYRCINSIPSLSQHVRSDL